jgi:replicative DNA helicase
MDNIDYQVGSLEANAKRVIMRDNEEGLIGAVLRGGMPVYQRVKDIVKPVMFGNVSYGEIWNAVEKLFERGMAIDTITVGDELERAYKLDSVSNGARAGRELLADLRAMGDPRNAESYAENVNDYHAKRILEDAGKRMVVWSVNGRRAADIMSDVSNLMGEIILYSSRAQDHVYDIAQAASAAYDETDAASKGMIRRVPSGYVDLDRMLNDGYTGGDLIILAARPGQGKTALLLSQVKNMMQEGKSVLFFSLEMTAKQIAQRLLSQISKVDLSRILRGKMTTDEWGRYNDAIDQVANMRHLLTIIDLPAVKIGNLRQLVRKEFAKKKYSIVMVDYIQLAEADEKKERRQLEVGQVSRGLKALAKEMDCPFLCAAQLSRTVETRTNKTPILSDLREAGDLEQDADIVMFIYKPEEGTGKEESYLTEIITAKHRNGSVGKTDLTYIPKFTRFESCTKIELN